MSQDPASSVTIKDQITSIFVASFAGVGALTLLIQLIRWVDTSNINGEYLDRAIYVSALITGAYFFFSISLRRNFHIKSGALAPALALVSFVLGVVGIEQHAPIGGQDSLHRLWLGFGPFVLGSLVIVSPFVWKIYRWESHKAARKALLVFLALASLVLTALGFWQDCESVIDPGHSEYVLNEVLSISAGRWPFSDFIPQYQILFTLAVAPLSGFLTAIQLTQVAFILMFMASMLTIFVAIFLVRRVLPSRSICIATLLIVPLTAVTQFPTREDFTGSIAALLSAVPIRIFPGVVIIGAVVVAISSLKKPTLTFRLGLVAIGIVAGLNMWSSQDFGIAAAMTILVAPLLITYDSPWKRGFIAMPLLLGTVTGLVLYSIFSDAMGHRVPFNHFAFFARQFGGGFGAESIHTPGPVLVILPLIIALISVHTKIISYSQNIFDQEKRATFYYAGVLGFFFASWSVLGFNYFLNRSYASGQLQILFLPVAISLACLVGALLHFQSEDSECGSTFTSIKSFFRINSDLVVSMVAALPMATLILLPNPTIELERIKVGAKAPRWPQATLLDSIADAQAGLAWANSNSVSVAFFGASANYVSMETGIRSASVFNNPFDMLMSQQTIDTACAYLAHINPDYLVVDGEGAALFRFENNTLCERYAFAFSMGAGIKPGRFAWKVAQ